MGCVYVVCVCGVCMGCVYVVCVCGEFSGGRVHQNYRLEKKGAELDYIL